MARYIFIDGSYFDVTLADLGRLFCGGNLIDLDYGKYFEHYDKKFYYTAKPPKKKDEVAAIYAARLVDFESRMKALRRLSGFHVFLGDTRGEGERTRQKGVDVQLSVHMLTHAWRKNAVGFTLLAGDLDFKPVVEALVSEGAFVTVLYGRGEAHVRMARSN